MYKQCEHCNKEFKIRNGHINQRFCCKSCAMMERYADDIGVFSRNDIAEDVKDYILGLIITDGCVRKNGNSKTICISLKDRYLIEMIHDLACPSKKIYINGLNNQVIWKSKSDIEYLESLGISERKTYTVRMPIVNNMWHLIRGVFDGDGCVYKDNIHDKKYDRNYQYTNISFTSGSIGFTNDLSNFLLKEGMHCTVTKDKRHNETYRINIRKRSSVKLMYEKMYENAGKWKLERKYDIFK